MAMKKFKLIKKEKLTDNVFHMVFQIEKKLDMQPWQFITFILPGIWGKAYSILEEKWNNIELIIKRVETGKWWSKYICDRNIWEILNWVWPAWKFLLKQNNENKLFIWTWTGLVPLYNQILFALKHNLWEKISLIFWVRFEKDLFFIKQLQKIKKENKKFSFEVYLSRENKTDFNFWYVTNFIKENSLKDFKEFYICWMPDMVDSVVLEIKNKAIDNCNIFTEKY